MNSETNFNFKVKKCVSSNVALNKRTILGTMLGNFSCIDLISLHSDALTVCRNISLKLKFRYLLRSNVQLFEGH